MGRKKAAWYSDDFMLPRQLRTLVRRSSTKIHPEWQNVNVIDTIPGGTIDFLATHVEESNTWTLFS
jgi:hypothetical protein